MEQEFDPTTAEAHELQKHLLDEGGILRVERSSVFRKLGKPQRVFYIHQPYLGTLDYLSREYLALQFSEKRLEDDTVNEVKHLPVENARLCARIVAIAILRSRWKIRLFTPFLTRYLLWRLTPAKLFQIVSVIHQMSNYRDFTNSIRFLSIQPRTTNPTLMEKKPGAEQPD